MRRGSWWVLGCAIVACGSAGPVEAALIYNQWGSNIGVVLSHDPGESASNIEIPQQFTETHSEVAHRINFTGTDRFVTSLEVGLWGFGGSPSSPQPVSLSVIARLYAVVPTGGSPVAFAPGPLVWEGVSPIQTIHIGGSSTPRLAVQFNPNVTVPNSVYLSLAHADISGQPANSPLVVGCAFTSMASPVITPNPWLAVRDTASGTWLQNPADQFNFSIAARINAVPAPGWAALAACSLLVIRRTRPALSRG